MKDPESAIKYAQRAIEHDSKEAIFDFITGIGYMDLKLFDKAADLCYFGGDNKER